MNNARVTMKVCNIIFLGLICVCGVKAFGENVRQGGVLHINIGQLSRSADLVLIGNLESVSPPYEVLAKAFYKITTTDVLKGGMQTNSLLVVRQNIDSSEGSNPIVEPNMPYLLFLEEVKLDDQSAPQNIAYYQVLRIWKGIIPLDKNAREKRPFLFIKKDYGINIEERLQDFKEAMTFSLAQQQGMGRSKSTLKESALAVYDALGLEIIGDSTLK